MNISHIQCSNTTNAIALFFSKLSHLGRMGPNFLLKYITKLKVIIIGWTCPIVQIVRSVVIVQKTSIYSAASSPNIFLLRGLRYVTIIYYEARKHRKSKVIKNICHKNEKYHSIDKRSNWISIPNITQIPAASIWILEMFKPDGILVIYFSWIVLQEAIKEKHSNP